MSANAAPSARKARTKTSEKAAGARAAKHSKAVVEEPVAAPAEVAPTSVVAPEVVVVETVVTKSVSSDDIAKLAYSYWVERGYQGGNPHEDWIRAEQALLATS